MGKLWRQEQDATGHTVSMIRKKNVEMPVFFLIHCDGLKENGPSGLMYLNVWFLVADCLEKIRKYCLVGGGVLLVVHF